MPKDEVKKLNRQVDLLIRVIVLLLFVVFLWWLIARGGIITISDWIDRIRAPR